MFFGVRVRGVLGKEIEEVTPGDGSTLIVLLPLLS